LHRDVENIYTNVRSNTYDAQNIYLTMPINCSWQTAFPNMEVREDLFSRRFCWRSSATAPIGRRHKAEGPFLAAKAEVLSLPSYGSFGSPDRRHRRLDLMNEAAGRRP
jgi:hypothetical protein